MRTTVYATCFFIAAAASAASIGCGSQPPKTASAATEHEADDHDHDHESGHGHDHQGPHKGQVIELGRDHQFHAELVEDEKAGSIAVYILDKDLKELPIEQESITINLVVGGEAKTIELLAAEVQDGRTSRFDAADQELYDALHKHGTTGKLRVNINGTPFSGEIKEHKHHDHEHGDDEHADSEHAGDGHDHADEHGDDHDH